MTTDTKNIQISHTAGDKHQALPRTEPAKNHTEMRSETDRNLVTKNRSWKDAVSTENLGLKDPHTAEDDKA